MFINVLPKSDVIHCLRAGDYDGVSDVIILDMNAFSDGV